MMVCEFCREPPEACDCDGFTNAHLVDSNRMPWPVDYFKVRTGSSSPLTPGKPHTRPGVGSPIRQGHHEL